MKLFDFQEKILNDSNKFSRCAYFLEMGLGKTFVGAEKLMRLNTHVSLVVCQKSKVTDWVEHFLNEYCFFGEVVVYDLTKPKEFTAFLNHDEPDIRVIGVINYDLAFRRKNLADLRDFTLMLDESQFVQSDKAKRTKFILNLKPKNVILLSGTPVGGRYEQLWTQCKLLGWNITKSEFWDRYINYRLYSPAPNVYPIKIVTGYKNVEGLKRNLAKYGATFLKTDEVIELPKQVFTNIEVPTNAEYQKFLTDKIVKVGDVELVGDNKLKELLYARQLCSTYSKEKLHAFKDWIDSNDNRLIVFYNFTSELDKLIELAKGRPISIVNGSTKCLDAYVKYNNSITFVQYQAGAMGLNLQKAQYIGYYSLPLASDLFEQSKKRIHRLGQTKTCFYYFFIAKNSVEEKIFETLKMRRDYTEKLFEKDSR